MKFPDPEGLTAEELYELKVKFTETNLKMEQSLAKLRENLKGLSLSEKLAAKKLSIMREKMASATGERTKKLRLDETAILGRIASKTRMARETASQIAQTEARLSAQRQWLDKAEKRLETVESTFTWREVRGMGSKR
ncbi:MAG: hypothetical protein HY751_12425 [Nitrospinae bacterium]|nr:hypothetical protein [Nitrospinota bacterium]